MNKQTNNNTTAETNPPTDGSASTKMRDVQARIDERHIALDEVGVSGLKLPLVVEGCEKAAGAAQSVQATLSLGVDLDGEHKGIHMSRLLESFLNFPTLSFDGLGEAIHALRDRQKTSSFARAEIVFDYFLTRVSPVSGRTAPQAYRCTWTVRLEGERMVREQKVAVPVTTLCPCSKEISDYGAHNQRGEIEVALTHEGTAPVSVCLEDIVEMAEASASAPLYPVLKREDERHVTMQAYENPAFVEDAARNVVMRLRPLRAEGRMDRFVVQVTNFESIHTHDAFAVKRSEEAGE